MSFLQQWLFEFTQLWHPYYFIFIGLACVLMLLLGRSSRGMLRFTALMLFLFLLFLISEALLNAADARSAASIFHYGALFSLGIVLIRQVGLCWFRLLLPRVNLHPPAHPRRAHNTVGICWMDFILIVGCGSRA